MRAIRAISLVARMPTKAAPTYQNVAQFGDRTIKKGFTIKVAPLIRDPTPRQIEIFRLRCQGLSNAEIGRRFGIRRNTADYAARTAATRLIRARPTLENAADQALAVEHFPKIAKRFSPTA